MKITTCQNRFEVVVGDVTADQTQEIKLALMVWLTAKETPVELTDEDYLAAMGPCGK